MISVEQIKQYGIGCINNAPNPLIESLIRLYTDKIEEYCNTKFVPAKHVFKTDYAKQVAFKHTPILEVESVTYKNTLLYENNDYYVYDNFVEFDIETTVTKKAVEITYIFGYEETPASVIHALLELIRLHIDYNNYSSVVTGENIGTDYSYTKILTNMSCFVLKVTANSSPLC